MPALHHTKSLRSIATRVLLMLMAAHVGLGTTGHCQVTEVHSAGAMQNLHRFFKDTASVLLDTLVAPNMYALGPVEALRGEIMVWDGEVFVGGVTDDAKQPFVLKGPQGVKAIFLAYSRVTAWDTIQVKANIENMQQLQAIVESTAREHGIDTNTPFPFLLFGKIQNGKGHIMYKDTGAVIRQKEDIDRAKYYYDLPPQRAQMLGFYSNQHHGIYTHHGSNIHVHYRLYSKHHVGHLDAISFDKEAPLSILLPRLK